MHEEAWRCEREFCTNEATQIVEVEPGFHDYLCDEHAAEFKAEFRDIINLEA